MPRKTHRTRTLKFLLAGILLGVAVGLPLSYCFQSGWVRAFVSLPAYLRMILRSTLDTLSGEGGGGGNAARVVKTTTLACAATGAALSLALARLQTRPRTRQPRRA